MILALLATALWAATSESPAAQQMQELVRWSHSETVAADKVSVNPHGYSSSKFTVPQGALNVSITGDFSVMAAGPRNGNGPGRVRAKDSEEDRDSTIEAYVLTDAAFVVWSSGYSTSTLYESGPIAGATIDASLPAGAGVYHLVFSNKNSSRVRTVHTNVLLRYKSWMPDAVVRLKDRFWNWTGL